MTDRVCPKCGHDKTVEYTAINYLLPRNKNHSRVAGTKARCCGCRHSWWIDAGYCVKEKHEKTAPSTQGS